MGYDCILEAILVVYRGWIRKGKDQTLRVLFS